MPRLVSSTGCPTIDAEMAVFADVVLRASEAELIVLRYAPRFRSWYVCGCQSVHAASGDRIPDAESYWQGVGYVGDAARAYVIFEAKPLHASNCWNQFYDDLAHRKPLRAIRD